MSDAKKVRELIEELTMRCDGTAALMDEIKERMTRRTIISVSAE